MSQSQQSSLLGLTVQDSISGMEGVVVATRKHETGCGAVLVQKKGLNKDGNPHEPMWIDVPYLDDWENLPDVEGHELMGKAVSDSVTGYEGVCVAVTHFGKGMVPTLYIQSDGLDDSGRPAAPYAVSLSRIVPAGKEEPVAAVGTGSSVYEQY